MNKIINIMEKKDTMKHFNGVPQSALLILS